MKIIKILFLILLAFIFSFCSNDKTLISIKIKNISCNYYNNDSLQQVEGYYPLRVYYTISINNLGNEYIYIPVNSKLHPTIHSKFYATYNNRELDAYLFGVIPEKLIIGSKDSSIYNIAVNIPPIYNNIKLKQDSLILFIKNISIEYKYNNVDKCDKYPPFKNFSIKKEPITNIKFRNLDTFGENVDWI